VSVALMSETSEAQSKVKRGQYYCMHTLCLLLLVAPQYKQMILSEHAKDVPNIH
jgi:hypothetical protein